jgi:hypothetical protein
VFANERVGVSRVSSVDSYYRVEVMMREGRGRGLSLFLVGWVQWMGVLVKRGVFEI